MTRLDPADIARLRLAADLPGLVGRFTKLRRAGRGFVGLCPFHDERNPSFSVYRCADGGWRYKCHGCGEAGDAIDWLMAREGLDFRAALGALGGGVLPDGAAHRPLDPAATEKAAREAAAHEARERDRAAALWRGTRRADGTVVETYLREARGLKRLAAIPPILRCGEIDLWDTSRHRPRRAWRGPAMVARIDAPDPDPAGGWRGIGVHLTLLEPDGAAKLDAAGRGLVDFDGRPLKVKKMRGGHKGGCIRLAFLAAGCASPSSSPGVLCVGEGIETSLTITDVTGLPAWAAGSLENMAGAAPPGAAGAEHPEIPARRLPATVPDLSEPAFPWDAVRAAGVTTAILLGDGDTRDLVALQAKLRRGANRAAAFGVTTRIAMSREGFDFNDLLRLAPRGAEGGAGHG